MASITARRSVLRGRPPALAGGRRGAITAHSRSVMSLGYRADKRLWSWRVVSSQAISSSASRPGGGNHNSLISLNSFSARLLGIATALSVLAAFSSLAHAQERGSASSLAVRPEFHEPVVIASKDS